MGAEDHQAEQSSSRENKPRKLWEAFVATVSTYCTSCHARKEQHEINEAALVTWTRRIAYGTWAAVFVAAGAAILLLIQLHDARQSFILDERPWVLLDNPMGPLPTWGPGPTGQKVRWNYRFKNWGKSPAKNITIYEFMSLGTGPFIQTNKGHPMTVKYQDALGNPYTDTFCVMALQSGGAMECGVSGT